MPLLRLPAEILSAIATHTACQEPFLPPYDLLALRASCRLVHHSTKASQSPSLWASAFRFRFDASAVARRNFHPTGHDYYEQLRHYTQALAALRTLNIHNKDGSDLEDLLRTVYIMLLDNNGKNRAQLEVARVDDFVHIYARTQLWTTAHGGSSDGWPADSNANAYAVWCMWMLTTPERLMQEDIPLREHIVTLLLSYVLNPFRYHQAEAPPAHFHLPLPAHSSHSALPFSAPSAHGPYPVYVHPSREILHPYFGSLALFSPPPISLAAKLLYFARREIIHLRYPTNIPATRAQAPPSPYPSPTIEDFEEINSHKGAEPPVRVTWDWERGCKLLNGVPTSNEEDSSVRWDADYWRRRLCGDAWRSQPKWRPGKVYVPGSMDGLWQGRLIIPMEQAMRHLIQHATYPNPHNFNESALRLTHQPIFMRLREHHSFSSTGSHVPFPPSHHQHQVNDDLSEWTDLSMRNAWFPGGGAHLSTGAVNFTSNAYPAPGSRLHSGPGERKKVLVTVDDNRHIRSSGVEDERNGWVYHTYNRRLGAAPPSPFPSPSYQGEQEEIQHHPGSDSCAACRERDALVRKGAELDSADHKAVLQAYEDGEADEWMLFERMFESVGLGRDQTGPESDEDDDEEDEDDGMDQDTYADEGEEGEVMEFMLDMNADENGTAQPVRRATDRAKIEKCDGIRDIVFSGTTDRKHAQAWDDYTFHGRVRPWDGLIGILRRSTYNTTRQQQSYVFFYGYLVGGENFVGNWRFAAADPAAPTWGESAFVMSRRKEDRGNEEL